jgi:hypothetical protein
MPEAASRYARAVSWTPAGYTDRAPRSSLPLEIITPPTPAGVLRARFASAMPLL